MKSVFPLAGATLVLFEVVGALSQTDHYLPLGGSHAVQMAVVFGSAFVISEFVRAFR